MHEGPPPDEQPQDVWKSRRYLPHFDDGRKPQHITFHLSDSLPKEKLERLTLELASLPPEMQSIERRRRVEEWNDAGYGCCIFAHPAAARMAEQTLLFFDGLRYQLFAWVVMPNHLHVLLEQESGWSLAGIVASWKKRMARQLLDLAARSAAGRAGDHANAPVVRCPRPVFYREYWDRYIRDQGHFQRVVDYIHNNPVKAGLVAAPEDWAWSSACRYKDGPIPPPPDLPE
ncbi:transposase [candidate division BRC1 bacterium HGW-BRC1-1]|jgi:REP element-mobilizing transposase RayT|nr:MAG: transposase [candidate division BRC1 bacterium HGW-BRC1-1]